MRQVVLDTETTGLELADGHRIIEIGCVELVHRRLSGRTWQRYLRPEREVDAGALTVHGITNEFLAGQPTFAEVAQEFLDFIDGTELIIHNAEFDLGFLDMELKRAGLPGAVGKICRICDSLGMARRMHPGQRNSLDALCKRYGVDNSNRDLHGALLDARILADVYLAMSGGQAALGLDTGPAEGVMAAAGQAGRGAVHIPVIQPNAAELAAHEQSLEAIERACAGRAIFRAVGQGAGDN